MQNGAFLKFTSYERLWTIRNVLSHPHAARWSLVKLTIGIVRSSYINDPRWGRDIVWDAPTLCKVPPVGFLAGAMAGMLGIGGGMVTGPLLLSLGMNSHVSSATTSFMLIFTASSTTIQ